MKRLAPLVLLLVMFAAAQSVRAADLFPTPDFSNHPIPQTPTPVSRPEQPPWHEFLDLAFFTAALAAATFFAVKGRSRTGLFLLSIVSLAWLGFWRKGCVCPIGAIQNVTQALCNNDYAASGLVIVIFVLPLACTLFFGRSYCASVCPLGAVQELVAVWPLQVPAWIDRALGILAYVYLGAAVLFAATGSAWIICRYDPFVGLFRLTAGPWMLALGAAFLVAGVFIGRPYCRWLCPYGAILSLLSRVSWWHFRIPPEQCVQCRLCEDACPYGAIRRPTGTLSPTERTAARRALIVVLAVAPLLVAAGALLGWTLRSSLAGVDPTVRLAEQIQLEESGQTKGTTGLFGWCFAKLGLRDAVAETKARADASEAFRGTGEPVESLYARADAVKKKFATGGPLFGGWVGLVFAVTFVRLSIRRRRTDYEPDRGACVSCGRCLWYCPEEHPRQEFIQIQQGAERQSHA